MSSTTPKPTIVGIYGVPGCGKTFLKDSLEKQARQSRFAFYDGSDMIETLCPGGLEAFKLLPQQEKVTIREQAIREITRQCQATQRIGIVTGHLSLWDASDSKPRDIYTPADLNAYTHIIYLDVPPDQVLEQRKNDQLKRRGDMSSEDISIHQQYEMERLRELCYRHRIQFIAISKRPIQRPINVSWLLDNFICVGEEVNEQRALHHVDQHVLFPDLPSKLSTAVVIDADKTLGPHDGGEMFWEHLHAFAGKDPLKRLYGSEMGYSFEAFRQTTLMCEEFVDDIGFDSVCRIVAERVELYPEMRSLLETLKARRDTVVFVVTCGVRKVWEIVLQRWGLGRFVRVIGGGRVDDGYVVTGEIKAAVVSHLQQQYGCFVWAVGDSMLDLKMMEQADQAVLVMGEANLRSQSMCTKLSSPDGLQGLRGKIHQVLLPDTVPRLDIAGIPTTTLKTIAQGGTWTIKVTDATTKPAAKLLMTPTRNATISGRALQEAHRKVGWYLATEYLTDLIGVEPYEIPHVQGGTTTGHRLRHEENTLIVPLMRGGEPMSFGVHDAFPLARFRHANEPAADLTVARLEGMKTIILVDSVINSGKSIVDFVNHIQSLRVSVRISVVANVVQQEAVGGAGLLNQTLKGGGILRIVALRLSGNKFTGKGGTDTGNRLFNTTHLE